MQTSFARSAKAHVFFQVLKLHATTFFFFFSAQLCIATFAGEDRYFPWQDFSESSALSAGWIMPCLLLMAVREVITTPFEGGWFLRSPWQVKSNVIVQWKASPCFVLPVLTTSRFSIQFSCWEEHRFARTKASPVNISHWLAGQMYLCSPSLVPPLSYLSVTLPFFRCSPPLPQTLPHLSIHPSSVFKHLSLIAGILLSSFSLPLFVCLSVSSSPPAHAAFVWVLSWNVLRDPVSNTGTRNIWHIFNSQGQLQLFIQRLRLNFPRFLLDLPQIAMCVCHILNQASFLCFPPLPATFHQIFQRLSSEF